MDTFLVDLSLSDVGIFISSLHLSYKKNQTSLFLIQSYVVCMFHVYLNNFEIAIIHLFLMIFCN